MQPLTSLPVRHSVFLVMAAPAYRRAGKQMTDLDRRCLHLVMVSVMLDKVCGRKLLCAWGQVVHEFTPQFDCATAGKRDGSTVKIIEVSSRQ